MINQLIPYVMGYYYTQIIIKNNSFIVLSFFYFSSTCRTLQCNSNSQLKRKDMKEKEIGRSPRITGRRRNAKHD